MSTPERDAAVTSGTDLKVDERRFIVMHQLWGGGRP